ncbi:MAG: pilus assembly protein [Anaerolineales bacterium]|nr:pilus assembly protein [Anaerolineales bacterium]
MLRVTEKGQAMAEFALMIPVLILLLFGMTFAAFYAFRSASVDWGMFIEGVASGSYNAPAARFASKSELWPDLSRRINSGPGGARQVRSLISVEDSRDWVFGIRLIEAQRAEAFFRLWRFYPGPPSGVIE